MEGERVGRSWGGPSEAVEEEEGDEEEGETSASREA